MLPIAAFYHCWIDGFWNAPATEYVTALRDSGFEAEQVIVGLVGSDERIEGAKNWFRSGLAFAGPVNFVTASEGYEQVTLRAVYSWARSCRRETAILYAHAKGSSNTTAFTRDWRRAMTRHMVARWDIGAALLGEYDACGCFWLTPERYGDRGVESPFFAGNFWWARASYLARLPEPPDETRFAAERWIGLGRPRVCDLLPGHPADVLDG